jgi:hypothetical protein
MSLVPAGVLHGNSRDKILVVGRRGMHLEMIYHAIC